MIQVKIVKAEKSTYWYAKYIGQVFTVDSYSVKDKEFVINRLPDNSYWYNTGAIGYNKPIEHYIQFNDCIVVSGDIKYDTHGDSKLKFYFV